MFSLEDRTLLKRHIEEEPADAFLFKHVSKIIEFFDTLSTYSKVPFDLQSQRADLQRQTREVINNTLGGRSPPGDKKYEGDLKNYDRLSKEVDLYDWYEQFSATLGTKSFWDNAQNQFMHSYIAEVFNDVLVAAKELNDFNAAHPKPLLFDEHEKERERLHKVFQGKQNIFVFVRNLINRDFPGNHFFTAEQQGLNGEALAQELHEAALMKYAAVKKTYLDLKIKPDYWSIHSKYAVIPSHFLPLISEALTIIEKDILIAQQAGEDIPEVANQIANKIPRLREELAVVWLERLKHYHQDGNDDLLASEHEVLLNHGALSADTYKHDVRQKLGISVRSDLSKSIQLMQASDHAVFKFHNENLNLVFNTIEDNTLDFTTLESTSAYDYAVQYILKYGSEETKNNLFELTGAWFNKADATAELSTVDPARPFALSYNDRRGFAVLKFLENVLPVEQGPAGWLEALSSSSMNKLYEFSQHYANDLLIISHTMEECRTVSPKIEKEQFDILLRLERVSEVLALVQKKIEQEKPKPGLLFKPSEEDQTVSDCFAQMEAAVTMANSQLEGYKRDAIESFKAKLIEMYTSQINFSPKTLEQATRFISLYGTDNDKLAINPLFTLLEKMCQKSADADTFSSIFDTYQKIIPSGYQQEALIIMQKIILDRQLPTDEESLKLQRVFHEMRPDDPEIYQHFMAQYLRFIPLTTDNYVQFLDFMEKTLTSQDPDLVTFSREWGAWADDYYQTTIKEVLQRVLLHPEDALRNDDSPSMEQLTQVIFWISRTHPEDFSLLLLQAQQYIQDYQSKEHNLNCLPLFVALDDANPKEGDSSLTARYLQTYFLKPADDSPDSELAIISSGDDAIATAIESVLHDLVHDKGQDTTELQHVTQYLEQHGTLEQKDELVLRLLEGFAQEDTFNQAQLDDVIALMKGRKEPVLFYTDKGQEIEKLLIQAAAQLLNNDERVFNSDNQQMVHTFYQLASLSQNSDVLQQWHRVGLQYNLIKTPKELMDYEQRLTVKESRRYFPDLESPALFLKEHGKKVPIIIREISDTMDNFLKSNNPIYLNFGSKDALLLFLGALPEERQQLVALLKQVHSRLNTMDPPNLMLEGIDAFSRILDPSQIVPQVLWDKVRTGDIGQLFEQILNDPIEDDFHKIKEQLEYLPQELVHSSRYNLYWQEQMKQLLNAGKLNTAQGLLDFIPPIFNAAKYNEFSHEVGLRQEIRATAKSIEEGGAIPDLPLISLEMVNDSAQQLFKQTVIEHFDSLIIRALESIEPSASSPLSPFRRVSELIDYLDLEQRQNCLAHFVCRGQLQPEDLNRLLGHLAYAARTERLLDNPKSPMALGLCGELIGLCGNKQQQQMFNQLLSEAAQKGLLPESVGTEYSSKLIPSSQITVDRLKVHVDDRITGVQEKIRDINLGALQQTYRDEISGRMDCIKEFIEAAIIKELGKEYVPAFKTIQKKFIEEKIFSVDELTKHLGKDNLFSPEEQYLIFRKKDVFAINDGHDGLRNKVKTALLIYAQLHNYLSDTSRCGSMDSIRQSFTELKTVITDKLRMQDHNFRDEVNVANHFKLPEQDSRGSDDEQFSTRLET